MRRKTKLIKVGKVEIGSNRPISVQTMTNTNTEDVLSTVNQIKSAEQAGCDIIRVSCPTKESTKALKEIIKQVEIPVIADIHFNYKRALESIDAGADCIRINPGNIGSEGMREIAKAANENKISIRIGINSGSLEKEVLDKYKEPNEDAIVESALLNIKKLEDLNFTNFKLSLKSSNVKTMISAYRKISKLTDYPLHLGVTESGTVFPGTIKSAIGIGSLLADGIGDTLRVSLSGDILEEIKVGKQILKSLNLLNNSVNIIACPTCSRTLINVIDISNELETMTEKIAKNIKISVLGCVVNGIGEAQESDIGVFGFQKGIAKLYLRGKEFKTIPEIEVINCVRELINEF